MLKRTLSLVTLALLSSALADTLTVRITGLPAGLKGVATVGKVSVPLGGTATLAAGAYTVTPRAVADGGKVYVAQPIKVTLKGKATATATYVKLPPGSKDPFFGSGGIRDINIKGLETSDNWQVTTSGPDTPILTSTGSFRDHTVAMVTLNGTLLGPVARVTSDSRPLDSGHQPSPLLRDGTGYLGGVSHLRGTVVRYTAQGQPDLAWKTTPEIGTHVRGLLRLPDGGVLAYGGMNVPEIWKLRPSGQTDSTFGESGILSLRGLDDNFKSVSYLQTGRVLPGGTARLVVAKDNQVMLVDVNQGQATRVAPSLTLPNDVKFPYRVRNITVNADGSTLLVTHNIPKDVSQLIRLTPSGQIDPAFRSPVIDQVKALSGMAVQKDGKILVAYEPEFDRNGRGLIIRFNPGGSIDMSWGWDGRVTLADRINALEIANDGKLKVVSAGLGQALKPDTAYIRITQLLTE